MAEAPRAAPLPAGPRLRTLLPGPGPGPAGPVRPAAAVPPSARGGDGERGAEGGGVGAVGGAEAHDAGQAHARADRPPPGPQRLPAGPGRLGARRAAPVLLPAGEPGLRGGQDGSGGTAGDGAQCRAAAHAHRWVRRLLGLLGFL